jgi:putative nucleotidyltransferase with HDIG domain
MVVEDDPAVLDLLTRLLQRLAYPVRGFADPTQARDALDEGDPVHLLITDQQMPEIDGITLIRHALELDPSTVAIVVTGLDGAETAITALRMGVVDYLLKPVDVVRLGHSVQRALMTRAQNVYHREAYGRLRDDAEAKTAEIQRQTRQLEAVTVATFSALVRLLEARSPYFRDHSQAVARLAEAMAGSLALPPHEVEAVRVAGLLHDVGMIAVPDAIIDKEEGLTDEELAFVRTHPRVAEKVLRPLRNLGPAVDYVLFHHERLNGSGYPEGRRGKEIPLGAQVVGLAEAFVALTESRAFREAESAEDAIAILRGAEGTWFAGRVLDALEESAQQAPDVSGAAEGKGRGTFS